MRNSKKTIFSGLAPSGNIHIGNYLGAIRQWVEIQNATEHQNIFCVVDEHAITTPQDPAQLRAKILEVFTLYLACGIDPKKSIIFVQSGVSEHAELGWILNTMTPIGELERMTQFKDKSQKQKSIFAGLLNYPVLMAADILLYQTNIVPVGEDQIQHIELARMIARKFNNYYSPTFTIPEAIVSREGKRIMGLDNPAKKMSKSAENTGNYIALLDSPEMIIKKIMSAVTDSDNEIKYNEKEKPAISNLLAVYSLFSDKEISEIEQEYSGKNYSIFKKGLAEVIIEKLSPIQKKYNDLSINPDYIRNLLREGANKAKKIASKTMIEVRSKIDFLEL